MLVYERLNEHYLWPNVLGDHALDAEGWGLDCKEGSSLEAMILQESDQVENHRSDSHSEDDILSLSNQDFMLDDISNSPNNVIAVSPDAVLGPFSCLSEYGAALEFKTYDTPSTILYDACTPVSLAEQSALVVSTQTTTSSASHSISGLSQVFLSSVNCGDLMRSKRPLLPQLHAYPQDSVLKAQQLPHIVSENSSQAPDLSTAPTFIQYRVEEEQLAEAKVFRSVIESQTHGGVPAPLAGVDGSLEYRDQLRLSKRQQKMARNRESAAMSRMKKKQHVQLLQAKVIEIEAVNYALRIENDHLRKKVTELENENMLLRNSSSELKGGARRGSVYVLTIVLLLVYNVAFLKSPLVPEAPTLLLSAPVYRSRSLLQYESVNSKLEEPVRSPREVLNSSDKVGSSRRPRPSLGDILSRLPVPLYFHAPSEALPQNAKVKKVVAELSKGGAREGEYFADCGAPVNQTHLSRIKEALDGLVYSQQTPSDLPKPVRNEKVLHANATLDKKLMSLRPDHSNCPGHNDVDLDASRSSGRSTSKSAKQLRSKKHEPLDLRSRKYDNNTRLVESIRKSIMHKPDTFYLVSFKKDYLVLPATSYNRTHRPKVSFMIPALLPSNETTPMRTNKIQMMQIDCHVVDTKFVHFHLDFLPPVT